MTGGLSALWMTGEREYYDGRCPNGCPDSGGATYGDYIWGAVPPGQTIIWPGNGYVSNPATVTYATIMHQWLWAVPGYPGSWYLYAHSVTFTACSIGHCFGASTDVGGNP